MKNEQKEMNNANLLEVENNMDILRLLDDWSWTDNTIKIMKLIEKEVVL